MLLHPSQWITPTHLHILCVCFSCEKFSLYVYPFMCQVFNWRAIFLVFLIFINRYILWLGNRLKYSRLQWHSPGFYSWVSSCSAHSPGPFHPVPWLDHHLPARGFKCLSVAQTSDDWHTISIASQAGSPGPTTGNLLWLQLMADGWSELITWIFDLGTSESVVCTSVVVELRWSVVAAGNCFLHQMLAASFKE